MANDEVLGPRKTMLVLVIVVGCFAVLWPRILSPLLVGNTQEQLKPNKFDREAALKQERPSTRGAGPHPALRERGRAIPPGLPPSTRQMPAHVRVWSPLSVYFELDIKPPPIPGMRPPLGAGGGGPVPAPKSSMGFVMPIYTICIIVFFVYTLSKILFKRTASPYDHVLPDPQFRRRVFRDDSRTTPDKLGKKETDTRDEEIAALRARLEETERAMQRIVGQLAKRDAETQAHRPHTNGTVLLNTGPVQIVTSEYQENKEESSELQKNKNVLERKEYTDSTNESVNKQELTQKDLTPIQEETFIQINQNITDSIDTVSTKLDEPSIELASAPKNETPIYKDFSPEPETIQLEPQNDASKSHVELISLSTEPQIDPSLRDNDEAQLDITTQLKQQSIDTEQTHDSKIEETLSQIDPSVTKQKSVEDYSSKENSPVPEQKYPKNDSPNLDESFINLTESIIISSPSIQSSQVLVDSSLKVNDDAKQLHDKKLLLQSDLSQTKQKSSEDVPEMLISKSVEDLAELIIAKEISPGPEVNSSPELDESFTELKESPIQLPSSSMESSQVLNDPSLEVNDDEQKHETKLPHTPSPDTEENVLHSDLFVTTQKSLEELPELIDIQDSGQDHLPQKDTQEQSESSTKRENLCSETKDVDLKQCLIVDSDSEVMNVNTNLKEHTQELIKSLSDENLNETDDPLSTNKSTVNQDAVEENILDEKHKESKSEIPQKEVKHENILGVELSNSILNPESLTKSSDDFLSKEVESCKKEGPSTPELLAEAMKEDSPKKEAIENDNDNSSVKVVGMEVTTHPADGSTWPGIQRPLAPQLSPPAKPTHEAVDVKSIYLETEIPQQSRVLVADFAEDRAQTHKPTKHAPLVVSGKMTLSLIQDEPRDTPERELESTLDEFTTASAFTQPAQEEPSDEELEEEIEVEEIDEDEEIEEETDDDEDVKKTHK